MRHTKSERLFLSAAIVLALCLCVPASAGAMHIMEGYLPVGHCILWGAVCLPFLAWGLVSIKRIAAEHRKAILLLAMMIPQVATMIPLFKMLSGMKLLNSVWGFILPSLSTPFLIMMFRQNSRNFPIDTMEAARIDGLNEFQIFYRMYMPMMKATYAAAGVITFMNAWNAYLWPKVIMTQPDAQTMPMLIANMSSGYTTDYGMLMVGVLFCSVPTMIVFFVLQKQFAEGITGAVK